MNSNPPHHFLNVNFCQHILLYEHVYFTSFTLSLYRQVKRQVIGKQVAIYGQYFNTPYSLQLAHLLPTYLPSCLSIYISTTYNLLKMYNLITTQYLQPYQSTCLPTTYLLIAYITMRSIQRGLHPTPNANQAHQLF